MKMLKGYLLIRYWIKLIIFVRKSDKISRSVRRCDRVADKSLALPGRKQATATVDFEFHISYL